MSLGRILKKLKRFTFDIPFIPDETCETLADISRLQYFSISEVIAVQIVKTMFPKY